MKVLVIAPALLGVMPMQASRGRSWRSLFASALLHAPRRAIRRVVEQVRPYLIAQRNARAAEDVYRHLSRLSDAELKRRGITRGDLHRCVFETLAKPESRPAARMRAAARQGACEDQNR